MQLEEITEKVPQELLTVLQKEGITELRPSQTKAIHAGLLDRKNILVCTPTASGKTLTAELVSLKRILENKQKAIYIVPLVALANEKYRDFKRKYEHLCRVALSVGDLDRAEPDLGRADLIVCTAEKLDSLLRHHAPWVSDVGVVVIDEIHLLNSPRRGPTLELLITLLMRLAPGIQILGLSATIGNPSELAAWLQAELVIDSWRPVELKQGIYFDGKIKFKE